MFSGESMLEIALKIDGSLIVLSGNNKDSDKIDLISKVIDYTDMVICSFENYDEEYGFWQSILYKSVMYRYNSDSVMPTELESKLIVNKYLSDKSKVLIIKDLEEVDSNIKQKISYELKDVMRKGVKIIVLSDSSHELDLIKLNPDLNGRVHFVRM